VRPRDPLRCVQATVAAGTARFRLWSEPPGHAAEGTLDFRTRSAAFAAAGAAGRVLETISTPDATYLRDAHDAAWTRVHSALRRGGTWEPFGVLDVVAALDELQPLEPEPAQRGALQQHAGRLRADAVARLTDARTGVTRRVRPDAAEDPFEVAVWVDSRLRLHRIRYRAAAALLHVDLLDFARARAVVPPARSQAVDLDLVRDALREAA
jgi:hypothetical protein